eukprot:TRINITY_DN15320_c0_g1_i2.p1 TRINITY_DN15320_c0_g1~~TRINITY_DN15320_c0_g1_i2.p1  ORF type:complete len:310 (+),score=98.57 TRINITY_DN15320_c0_g1_i2:86-931(+)
MPRRVMVCLDEGGTEGLDALRVGYHLCEEGTQDELYAVSVVANSDKDAEQTKRLERTYADELRQHSGTKTQLIAEKRVEHGAVSELLIKRSLDIKANVVVLGVDNKEHDQIHRHVSQTTARRGSLTANHLASGTVLGAVADPLIRRSTINVCVVPLRSARDVPPASSARRWVIAMDGSKMSNHGLQQLLSDWANESDEVRVVTFSRYNGKNDEAILEGARKQLAERKYAKAEAVWERRDTQLSVGQQLCQYAWDNEASFLCTSTGQSSMHRQSTTRLWPSE